MIGHGLTDGPDAHYTLRTFVDHLGDFIDEIDKVLISGESLGAMVGTLFMPLMIPVASGSLCSTPA
jgi:pimeloyl-ACP methyl ester carboxylesterase